MKLLVTDGTGFIAHTIIRHILNNTGNDELMLTYGGKCLVKFQRLFEVIRSIQQLTDTIFEFFK